MTNAELVFKISLLPDDLKEELSKLLDKWTKEKSVSKVRTPGLAKGKIKMKKNFDAPIDDFKDYQ